MPYSIRKLPGKNKYRVRQMNTGKIVAKGTTLDKAKAQIRFLNVLHALKRTQ